MDIGTELSANKDQSADWTDRHFKPTLFCVRSHPINGYHLVEASLVAFLTVILVLIIIAGA